MDNISYRHFTEKVDDYDTVADNVVIKNDEMHKVLLQNLPFSEDARVNILDLGCGTGHSMSMILRKYSYAVVTGIDFSERMISKCLKKIDWAENRIHLIEADINDYGFNDDYDAVITVMTLHNTTHKEKIRLFTKIYDVLKPGGLFINADFVIDEDKIINEQKTSIYRRYVKSKLSGNKLKLWLEHIEKDRPMSLLQQFNILEECGFSKTCLKWKYVNEAVYVAIK